MGGGGPGSPSAGPCGSLRSCENGVRGAESSLCWGGGEARAGGDQAKATAGRGRAGGRGPLQALLGYTPAAQVPKLQPHLLRGGPEGLQACPRCPLPLATCCHSSSSSGRDHRAGVSLPGLPEGPSLGLSPLCVHGPLLQVPGLQSEAGGCWASCAWPAAQQVGAKEGVGHVGPLHGSAGHRPQATLAEDAGGAGSPYRAPPC